MGVINERDDSIRETACDWTVEKRHGDWTEEQIANGEAPTPYEILRGKGNLLVTVGALLMWQALAGAAPTYFNAANAHLGVGDSSTAAAIGQTNLQAATNKLRKPMDAGWPDVGTADGLDADNKIQFKASFATGDANWAWNEWGVFNHVTAGSMLSRKVESLGTKASGTWTLTVTLSLA